MVSPRGFGGRGAGSGTTTPPGLHSTSALQSAPRESYGETPREPLHSKSMFFRQACTAATQLVLFQLSMACPATKDNPDGGPIQLWEPSRPDGADVVLLARVSSRTSTLRIPTATSPALLTLSTPPYYPLPTDSVHRLQAPTSNRNPASLPRGLLYRKHQFRWPKPCPLEKGDASAHVAD